MILKCKYTSEYRCCWYVYITHIHLRTLRILTIYNTVYFLYQTYRETIITNRQTVTCFSKKWVRVQGYRTPYKTRGEKKGDSVALRGFRTGSSLCLLYLSLPSCTCHEHFEQLSSGGLYIFHVVSVLVPSPVLEHTCH